MSNKKIVNTLFTQGQEGKYVKVGTTGNASYDSIETLGGPIWRHDVFTDNTIVTLPEITDGTEVCALMKVGDTTRLVIKPYSGENIMGQSDIVLISENADDYTANIILRAVGGDNWVIVNGVGEWNDIPATNLTQTQYDSFDGKSSPIYATKFTFYEGTEDIFENEYVEIDSHDTYSLTYSKTTNGEISRTYNISEFNGTTLVTDNIRGLYVYCSLGNNEADWGGITASVQATYPDGVSRYLIGEHTSGGSDKEASVFGTFFIPVNKNQSSITFTLYLNSPAIGSGVSITIVGAQQKVVV